MLVQDRINILIIDDNSADRHLYQRSLSKSKYNVYEAFNGKKGISMYKDIRPDCVLLDYRLPDANGIDILNELSALDETLPNILLTGQGDERIAENSLKNGAQTYLEKKDTFYYDIEPLIQSTIEKVRLEKESQV